MPGRKKQIAADHEMLSTIVGSVSDGVIAVDLDFNIIFINKAAERITGHTASQAMGRPGDEILRTNLCGDKCPLRQTLASHKPIVNRSVCMTNKKGQRKPLSISTAVGILASSSN